MKKNCVVCDKEMEGRSDKLYCSRPCQTKARKIREKNGETGSKIKRCPICEKEFTPIKYAHNRTLCYECHPNGYRLDRHLIIKMLKKKLNNECALCGYNKCLNALEFHHLNPNEKDIIVSDDKISFTKIIEESKKCILICANCHREVHEGVTIIEIKKDGTKNKKGIDEGANNG